MHDNMNTAEGGTATPGDVGRLFTQEELNRIIQDRLAKERAKYGNQKDTNPEAVEKGAEAEVSEVDEIKAELKALRQKVDAEKAEIALQKRFADVSKDAKWINDFTSAGVYREFVEATTAPEHAGKTDKEIYSALTTDKWYFQNPNPPADGIGVAPLPSMARDPIREGMGLNRRE